MGVLRRRLGAFVAIVTLTLTPAARVACLALCAAPPDGRQAAGAPLPGHTQPGHTQPGDPRPTTAAAHAHHHPRAAAPAADATTASARAWPDTRCDSERDRGCADRARIVPLPAARAAATDAVPAPPTARLAMANPLPPIVDARPLLRVAPPGPPPASVPLRV